MPDMLLKGCGAAGARSISAKCTAGSCHRVASGTTPSAFARASGRCRIRSVVDNLYNGSGGGLSSIQRAFIVGSQPKAQEAGRPRGLAGIDNRMTELARDW